MAVRQSDKVTLFACTTIHHLIKYNNLQCRVLWSAEPLKWFLTTDSVNFCCGSQYVMFHPLLPFKA